MNTLTGCSTDECMQNRNALPLAGFYSDAQDHAKINIDSVQVCGVGAPGDSVLFNGLSRISQLYLPFRLDSDTTRYLFRYLHKELAAYDLKDTVTFIYDRTPRFVSSACGVSYVFTIKEIRNTGMLIDSVACPAGEITNMATENLEIFFRVEEE
ncbi:MAG: hypothetical protein K2K97_00595 [Muribaculaceae bacterium]|nr:hypothetical protein [Muribaculaceae bacterium]